MTDSYLIAYDITNEKRLNRVCRYLKGKGIHLQKSVFFCVLNAQELKKIVSDLFNLIDSKNDDVRIYPVLFDFNEMALGDNQLFPCGVYFHFTR